jgi:hypothetical protein
MMRETLRDAVVGFSEMQCEELLQVIADGRSGRV